MFDLDWNIKTYPWFVFFAAWFFGKRYGSFFKSKLTLVGTILRYEIYCISTLMFEVHSWYIPDQLGRCVTLLLSTTFGAVCCFLFLGTAFLLFTLVTYILAVSMPVASDTDSALLFESLKVGSCGDELEDQDVKAWRFPHPKAAILDLPRW